MENTPKNQDSPVKTDKGNRMGHSRHSGAAVSRAEYKEHADNSKGILHKGNRH